eukprot:scaffold15168_cov126-Isochrysis_galbana.AAC.1
MAAVMDGERRRRAGWWLGRGAVCLGLDGYEWAEETAPGGGACPPQHGHSGRRNDSEDIYTRSTGCKKTEENGQQQAAVPLFLYASMPTMPTCLSMPALPLCAPAFTDRPTGCSAPCIGHRACVRRELDLVRPRLHSAGRPPDAAASRQPSYRLPAALSLTCTGSGRSGSTRLPAPPRARPTGRGAACGSVPPARSATRTPGGRGRNPSTSVEGRGAGRWSGLRRRPGSARPGAAVRARRGAAAAARAAGEVQSPA